MSDLPSPPRTHAELLAAIPAEVLEHDCGCGSAWRRAREGETAIDLGCGSGKTCFLLSQVVGRSGSVIGVDASAAMLDVARFHQEAVARAVGGASVQFIEARIEDLGRAGGSGPLVADGCADVVVLDCVLTFVQARERGAILAEAMRLLRPGGRLEVADIVGADLEGLRASLEGSGFEHFEMERSDVAHRVIDGIPRFATTMRARRKPS